MNTSTEFQQEPAENFQQLYAQIRNYFLLQKEYLKVDFVEKLSIIFSTFLILLVIIVLIMSILFFLFIALAYTLQAIVGSLALSFLIVALMYVILLLAFYLLRKQLVINPIVRLLSALFLTKHKD